VASQLVPFYDDGNGDFSTFSYTGNATDDRDLDIVGFQPNFILLKGDDSGHYALTKFEDMTGDATHSTNPTVSVFTDGIQAFRTSGFQVGTHNYANENSVVFHGFAFKNVDGASDSHTYAGNSTDDRQITVQGTTFTPKFVLAVEQSGDHFHMGSWQLSSDSTFRLDSGNWIGSNYIQARNSSGFEVGDNAKINQTGQDYRYIAVTSNAFVGVVDGEDQTEGSGFTELVDAWDDGGTYANSLHTMWRNDADTTVDSSTTGSWDISGIAIEIKKATGYTAAIAGTATASINDSHVVAGGKTITISLTSDTWVAAGATFDAVRQAIINGLTSAQSEGTGWNAEVRDKEVVSSVVRTSATTVTITLTAAASYAVTASETITVTIPASALVLNGSALIASPTIVIGTGNYMPNGDVNWDNPPTLDSIGAVSVSSSSNESYTYKHIDLASDNAMEFTDVSGIVIENCLITNCGGTGINLLRCDTVTIRNCRITDTNGNVISTGQAMYIDDCGDDIIIEGNWLEDVSAGVTFNQCDSVTGYRVRYNFFKNMQRSHNQGEGVFAQYCGPMDLWVHDNTFYGVPADCVVEDWINMYRSYGTSSLPIRIYNNRIQGSGTSASGGGIMSSDVGSEGVTSAVGWVLVYDNWLVDPGQYGIAMTAGHDVDVYDNSVFSSSNNPNISISNVGIYAARYGTSSTPGSFYGCTITGNNVLWYEAGGTEEGSWFPSKGGWDDVSPNHTDVNGGTTVVNPSAGGGNDFSYSAWDADSGNQGSTDLSFPTVWTYHTP